MLPILSPRTHHPRRRNQHGALLLEALLGGMVIAAGLGTVMMLKYEEASDQKDATVAQQTRIILDAAKAYIEDNFATVEANAQADGDRIIEIPVATIQAADYLSPSFQNTNAYGQSYTTYVRWLANDQLEVIVPSRGGQAIPDVRVPRVASMIGTNGGYVFSSSQARGAQGTWQMNINPYQSAGAGLNTGRVVATQYYADGQLIADYLYRNQVPGMPEANRMNTAIDMNGNNINSAATVNATTVSASTVNATNVTATATVSGNVVAAASRVQVGSESLYPNRVAMINALYGGTLPASTAGGGSLSAAGSLAAGADLSVARDATVGRDLAVSGSSTFLGAVDARLGVTLGPVASSGAPCSPNGRVAATAAGTGETLQCRGGVWQAFGGTLRAVYCSNADSSPDCVAARSNSGRGTGAVRPTNCVILYGGGPYVVVGGEMRFYGGKWQAYNGAGWWDCDDGSLMALVTP